MLYQVPKNICHNQKKRDPPNLHFVIIEILKNVWV